MLKDGQSANGTYVNGRKLRSGHTEPLFFGDHITLANTVLTFGAEVPRIPDLSGQQFAARYRLGECLHASPKAATYPADDEQFPRQVAIKVFSPFLSRLSHYQAEFRRQAHAAKQLRHASICAILDYGTTTVCVDGAPADVEYLCMDLLTGGDLPSKIDRDGAPRAATVVNWVGSLATALDHAHQSGIVHGGLKPGCIVFDRRGAPFLTDFASSTYDGSEAPILGSPAYLAPEQWAGETPTPRTDEFALAAVAYWALTGAHAFEGQENPEVRRRNFARGPEPAHAEMHARNLEEIPAAVSQVIARATSLKADHRFGSPRRFAAALRRAMTGQSMSSGPRAFISYRRDASAGWANLIASTLSERFSIDTFLDTGRRDASVRIPDKIRRAITECQVFICMLAPDTLQSDWVQREIKLAYESGRPFIPVFQERFDPVKHAEDANSHVASMLEYDCVHLMDERNILVEHSIADLAKMISETVGNASAED